MFGQNLKKIRQEKGLSINELSRKSGVNASYISAIERGQKKNPSKEILEKLVICLGTTMEVLFSEDISKISPDSSNLEKFNDFATAEDAMHFLLQQQSVMGRGGFDIEKLSESQIIEFANELLNQLELLGFKYSNQNK